jgi:Fur family ferric uptake transcriptional regulator
MVGFVDEAIRESFDKFIRGKGLRRTPQRDAIVECVFSTDEHFTADELCERIRTSGISGSRATVYRTLSLLVEAGLLQEIDIGGDQTTYDPNFLNRPGHNHLVCIDCGRVVEFEDESVEKQLEALARNLGYEAMRQSIRIEACCRQLRITGSCPNLIQARLQKKRLPHRKK